MMPMSIMRYNVFTDTLSKRYCEYFTQQQFEENFIGVIDHE